MTRRKHLRPNYDRDATEAVLDVTPEGQEQQQSEEPTAGTFRTTRDPTKITTEKFFIGRVQLENNSSKNQGSYGAARGCLAVWRMETIVWEKPQYVISGDHGGPVRSPGDNRHRRGC